MKIKGQDYRSTWYENGKVKFIDQTKLPSAFEIYEAETTTRVATAIKNMIVRGAPAIGAAAAYGMAIADDVDEAADTLQKTRPTAHDLFFAIGFMREALGKGVDPITAANVYVDSILQKCRKIGDYGKKLIKDGMRILTHCNAGALATVDYGTALSPLRFAHTDGKKFFVYCDETRPRLQGLLTAWELANEGIEHAVIADNAAGYFMQRGEIDLVIVGADRIAKNGDVANKIGTYEKAVLAKENKVPFYVAALTNSIDTSIESGKEIIIEERGKAEVLEFNGERIAPAKSSARNPAFDVTPAKYIKGIITEKGIVRPNNLEKLFI